MEQKEKSVFETLSGVKLKTEKKGRFDYASWATAWKEVKKCYPNASFKVYTKENVKDGIKYDTGINVFAVSKAKNSGVFVKVGTTINEQEYIEFYPVTNNYNKAIPTDMLTVFEVNTAIKRALVKSLAFQGLGLNIFEGEEFKEEEVKK